MLDLSKIKFYLSKGIVRVSCHDEKQQGKLLKISKLGEIQVTATLPWMLTKSSESIEIMDDKSKPEKAPKIFEYVISGVSKEVSENEIQNSTFQPRARKLHEPVNW